jgi:hypothetical protein
MNFESMGKEIQEKNLGENEGLSKIIHDIPDDIQKKFDAVEPPWETKDHDLDEKDGKKGGSYGELKEAGFGWPDSEVHHMPAKWASELSIGDGPAIVMDKADHRQTASCGLTNEAQEYREKQKEFIENGDFRGALQMDIDDIHDKFGDKYDKSIEDMLKYVNKLEEEGRV